MVCFPKEVDYKICYYNDPTLPLMASDYDSFTKLDVENNQLTEGDHKAVILSMSLPSSTYATMALRELLKMDTSTEVSFPFYIRIFIHSLFFTVSIEFKSN